MVLAAKLVGVAGGPGLLATGVLGLSSGIENGAYIVAIVGGMFVVAVAGIFTIRSNVARIWREQAEGEKARNDDLNVQIAGMRRVIDEQRAEKTAVTAELAEAKRGDQSAVLEMLGRQHKELIELLGHQHTEVLTLLGARAAWMPTPARRRLRVREARATLVFVSVLLVLMLAGFAKIYTQTQQLQTTNRKLAAQQRAVAAAVYQTCLSRNQSRADTNQRLLVPLRASLDYLADLVLAAARENSGHATPTAAAAAERFGHRYLAYAAAVKPYAPLRCTKPV